MAELAGRPTVGGKETLVVIGDPFEALAQAWLRHAARVSVMITDLNNVGRANVFGDTVEGRAAFAKFRDSLRTGPESFVRALEDQIRVATRNAETLRAIGKRIRNQEEVNAAEISRLLG